ncbi:MAG: hypothetical protein WC807_03960 [Hyphomicrobium sp.]
MRGRALEKKVTIKLARLAAICVMALVATPALPVETTGEGATTPSWDRPASIKGAAERLARLHRAQGPKGAYKFIDACYKTHSLASKYGEAFESCIVQDYLETNMLLQLYSRIPPETLQQLNAVTPQELADTMGRRIVAALKTYELPIAHAEELKRLVDQHGAPVFLSIVFPAAAKSEPEKEKSREEKPANDRKKSKE